jgi:hypothetical protein
MPREDRKKAVFQRIENYIIEFATFELTIRATSLVVSLNSEAVIVQSV